MPQVPPTSTTTPPPPTPPPPSSLTTPPPLSNLLSPPDVARIPWDGSSLIEISPSAVYPAYTWVKHRQIQYLHLARSASQLVPDPPSNALPVTGYEAHFPNLVPNPSMCRQLGVPIAHNPDISWIISLKLTPFVLVQKVLTDNVYLQGSLFFFYTKIGFFSKNPYSGFEFFLRRQI